MPDPVPTARPASPLSGGRQRNVGPATKQRIRAALRAALNAAVAQRIVTFNAASHVELPSGRSPKPLVWTDERVEWWCTTGERPSPVMVWTPEQTGRFLDHAAGDRLYGLFQLIAYRGLRRGEARGLQWTEIDLDAGTLTVRRQLLVVRGVLMEGPPKSRAGERDIALDRGTVGLLEARRARQRASRTASSSTLPWRVSCRSAMSTG
jgi:integrase